MTPISQIMNSSWYFANIIINVNQKARDGSSDILDIDRLLFVRLISITIISFPATVDKDS